MNEGRAKAQIQRHEGLRLKPYIDTAGKVTIGFGRNISDVGISRGEAQVMFDNDFYNAVLTAKTIVGPFDVLDDARQEVLVNMAFNLGNKLAEFHTLMACLDAKDFAGAAKAMKWSAWFGQVGNRGAELVAQMETGIAK